MNSATSSASTVSTVDNAPAIIGKSRDFFSTAYSLAAAGLNATPELLACFALDRSAYVAEYGETQAADCAAVAASEYAADVAKQEALALVPCVTFNGTVLSKKDALALAHNKGFSRRVVEAAIMTAHRENATRLAESGALELGRAARLGHKVVRSVTKSGGIAYRISAKAMAEKKESAKDKVARLEAEIAALRASAS